MLEYAYLYFGTAPPMLRCPYGAASSLRPQKKIESERWAMLCMVFIVRAFVLLQQRGGFKSLAAFSAEQRGPKKLLCLNAVCCQGV